MTRFGNTLGGVMVAASLAAGRAGADTLPVAADAHVDSLTKTDGGGPELRVRYAASHGESRALARFDLSALPVIPPGSSIEKATLRLWVGAISEAGTLSVAAVLEPWDEANVTFADAPALEPPFTTFPVGPSDAQRYVSVDVTGLVHKWVSGARENHGLALVAAPDEPVDVLIDSKENAGTSHPMDLEVALTSVGPQGPPGMQGPPGVQGPPGLSGYERSSIVLQVASHHTLPFALNCRGGRRVLSGGVDVAGAPPDIRKNVYIHSSFPQNDSVWTFFVSNANNMTVQVRLFVTCAFTN
jgi:hypothetical protein